jgi:hypothetical protein
MCYMVVLSTDSDRDLTQMNSGLVVFSREMPTLPEAAYLQHANRWHLGSCEGCSCGFRHLMPESVSLGFGEPEDWFPEEEKHVQATAEAVAAFRSILADGSRLDCIDGWASDDMNLAPLDGTLEIDLGTVPAASFRFFENHRFALTDTATSTPSLQARTAGPESRS